MPRYFTVDEVNDILPELSPVLGELLERRARVVRETENDVALFTDYRSDIGGALPSEIAGEIIVIERLLDKVRAYGCEIKDLNGGLIDFLAKKEGGREVYLCWRYGEPPEIRYYHELHTGFGGRREIRPSDIFVT